MEKIIKILGKFDFGFVGGIEPSRDGSGSIIELYPERLYKNDKKLPLLKDGLGPYCKFSIPNSHLNEPGVYILVSNFMILYVGECEDILSRINMGYGNISPRNCFKGGQSTNCRINKAIFSTIKARKEVLLYFAPTENRFHLEFQLIKENKPPWNKTIGKPALIGHKERVIKKVGRRRLTNSSLNTRKRNYHSLYDFLKEQNQDEIILSFKDIEKIIKGNLPASARKYNAWWSNGSHSHSNYWLKAGYNVTKIVVGHYVQFIKVIKLNQKP